MTASAALEWTRRQVASGRIPEAVVAVGSSSGPELVEGVGVAAESRFALFSITKPVVALAAVRAMEDGALSPRTPLDVAVTRLATPSSTPIRLVDLLSHSSGLREPALDAGGDLRAALAAAGQDFMPGTAMRYSSLAFEGVAALLEQCTAREVDDHLAALLAAAGVDSGAMSFDARGARPVRGVAELGFELDALLAQRHPGAGLVGRAVDLLELGGAVLRASRDGGPLLARSSLEAMLRPRTVGLPAIDPEPERRDFGLGWQVRGASAGVLDSSVFGHAGWSGPQWWISPATDRVAVLLTGVADFASAGVDADEFINSAFAPAGPGGRRG